MALPYEGDTEFGRNGAYELTQHDEEVRPIAVKQRSSSASHNGTEYEFENQKPKGCCGRAQKSCNDFFLMICPGCITQIPSVVLILLAIIVVLFIILSIPLVFALTYSQPAAQLGEQPDQVLNNRDPANYWPFGVEEDLAVSENNGTVLAIEDLLPPNVKMCKGMGFVCASNPGITVGTYARCDGVANCPDGSDEAGCGECQTSFSCLAKGQMMCFRADVLCDGIAHCDDHSDEKMCQSSTCSSADQFKCSDMCLPKSYVCDGESHCVDSSDEKDCEGKCKNGSKWCKTTSSCIPKWKLCDGIRNCPDGSDENDCNCKTCSGKGKMLCKKDGLEGDEGFCVQLDRICDGNSDCPNAMDEDGCPSKNSTLFGVLQYSMKYL